MAYPTVYPRSLEIPRCYIASSGSYQVFPYLILIDGMAGYVGLNGRSPRINPRTDFIVLAGSSTSYTKYSDCTKKTRKLYTVPAHYLAPELASFHSRQHQQLSFTSSQCRLHALINFKLLSERANVTFRYHVRNKALPTSSANTRSP